MLEAVSRRHLMELLGAGTLFTPAASGDVRDHIDTEWFRQTLARETENWLRAAVTPNGFFQVKLDREWRAVGDQAATLTSQNRQIYVMATGYELTRDRQYQAALTHGADFLLANSRDSQHGGMLFTVSPDGKVLDDRKDCYGHSFAIFGLSHAARVTRDEKYRQAALETWSEMKKNLRDQAGFFKPGTTRDFSEVRGTNSQNPMMHLFEALLALHDATGSREVYQDAEAHVNAMFSKGSGQLFEERAGYLPEVYDAQWKPLPASKCGRVDLGHQFEWAYLLSHAVEKNFPQRYLGIGERLLEYGMRVAYDAGTGGIFSVGDYEGNAVREPKGWWQQCELLRALMHYAVLRKRPDLWEPFHQSLEFVKRNFMDSEHGGWYFSHDPGNPSRRAGQAGYGYHVCGMYDEALRLAAHPG